MEVFCRRGVKRSSSFQDLDKAKMAKRVYQVWKGSNVSVSIPPRSLSLSLCLSHTYSCLVGSLFVVYWGDFSRPIAIAAARVLGLSSSRCGIPRFFFSFFWGRMADV